MALRHYDASLGKGLLPGEQESGFKRLLDALQQELEDLQRGLTSAEQVLISLPAARSGLAGDITMSLQEYLEPLINDTRLGMVPSGVIVPYFGTWSDAQNLVGWAICDGSKGTPNIVGTDYRYIRFVATGKDAGAVGGSFLHTTPVHTDDDIVAAIEVHAQHAHAYSGTTDLPSESQDCLTRTSNNLAAHECHNHPYSGNTDENPEGGSIIHEGSGTDVEHEEMNYEPPHRDYIPIMKL